jgi:tRNA(Phe) wybutosine-synthesizing methylase Tyw3
MSINYAQIIITLSAAFCSGLIGVFFNYKQGKKKELSRLAEKQHDSLLIELKDLQIKLYKLEKDLDEWKQKYYDALQELIHVKSDLEESLLKLEHIGVHIDADDILRIDK